VRCRCCSFCAAEPSTVIEGGLRRTAHERGRADAVKRAAGRFDLNFAIVEIRRAEDIAPAIEALKGLADALIVPSEPSTTPIEFRSS